MARRPQAAALADARAAMDVGAEPDSEAVRMMMLLLMMLLLMLLVLVLLSVRLLVCCSC